MIIRSLSLAARVVAPVLSRGDLRALERLQGHSGRKLAAAMRAVASPTVRAMPNLEQIETWRAQRLADPRPLVDGSLGPAGIYDGDTTIAEACRVSKPPRAARLLYCLVKEFRPREAIELGTNIGISAAYLANGMRENGFGRLLTFESSPYRTRLAQQLHGHLGLTNCEYREGLFVETLEPAVRERGAIDMAFVDGHHQYQPTLDYCEIILRQARPGCVFIFDDIRWSKGMRRAWEDLRRDTRFSLVADLHSVGIGVLPQIHGEAQEMTDMLRWILRGS